MPPVTHGSPGPEANAKAAEPGATAREQALRLHRMLMAAGTYAIGWLVLALCAGLGLLPWAHAAQVAGAFLIVNLAFFAVLRSGRNLNFADPSMTAAQVAVAVTMVAFILIVGRDVLVVAVPFYSVLFVFGMLRLRPRQLGGLSVYVLVSYGFASWVRHRRFGDALDWRLEAVSAALVLVSAIWFGTAASYISNLRHKLRETVRELESFAVRDGLTGLSNRRHIDTLLDAAVQRAARSHTPLCVALLDLDHFKAINDSLGHAAGDAVLKGVSAAMRGALRAGDLLGRFGGEEFLLILPGSALEPSLAGTQRLRSALAAAPEVPGLDRAVTASAGLAQWQPGESAAELVARADRALYRAKAEGRDRVCLAED